jgi:hypothetical protein
MELDFDNQRLADELCRGNLSLKLAWLVALNRLSSAGVSVEDRTRICRACPEPRFAIRFSALLGDTPGDESLRGWFEAINESAYPENQWYEAIDLCFAWLEDNGRRGTLQGLTGYLECSASSQGSTGNPESLPEIVASFLDKHGIAKES